MALTGLHTVTNYEDALKIFVANNEGNKTKFYSDGVGIPTIGAGYALTKHSNWFSDFTSAGISLTSAQKSAIEALYSFALSHSGDDAAVKSYIATEYGKNAISLTPNQIGELFLTTKKPYEDQAIAVMGDANKNTKEFIALVDIAYNMGSIGPNLTKAIQKGNRAEAWYEIRYNSNNPISNSYKTVGVGIASRRIIQSDYLGLYSNSPTEDDYKQIMRMYTFHKDKIFGVEHDNTVPSGNKPNTVGSAYIGHETYVEIFQAEQYLKDTYSQGVSIDGDVQVGKGLESYAYLENGNYNDTLTGTSKNDLIFGERGSDTLNSGAGNDVLYGGADNDTLIGGSGNDTYIFNLGDGSDTISDTSGFDIIKFGSGIGIDDLVFYTGSNYLIIGVKEAGKSIWELRDKIIINDWRHSSVKKFSLQGSRSGINGTDGDLFFSKSGIQNGESIEYDFTDLFGQKLSSDSNDILYLSDANEYVMGQGGDDTINAFGGNDVIMGGTGNDTIYGGEGDDTYLYSFGDGQDTILNTYTGGGTSEKDINSNDTLILGNEITSESVKFIYTRDSSLLITMNETDSIDAKQWFGYNTKASLQNIQFADGTVLTRNDIYKYYMADDNSNGITGSLHDETLYGYGGIDYISGNGGNDTIIGGQGNDEIRAAYNGIETFVFNIGDGQDVIDYVGKNDTIEFGSGITLDDIDIRMVTGPNRGFKDEQLMVISFKEEGKSFEEWSDKITLRRSSYQFNISFSDCSSVNVRDLNDRFGFLDIDNVVAFNEENEYDLGAGNDILYAPSDGAIINAGTGDDSISTDYGNQIFLFQRGDGRDYIDDYNGFTRYNGSSENDIIRFIDDTKKEDLNFKVDGNNLLIAIKEEGKSFDELHDIITVREWYAVSGSNIQSGRVERIEFSDGSFLTPSQIISMMGTDGNDFIKGLELSDILQGGKGNDTLVGGNGDDIYIYNLGDGSDIINDLHDSRRVENNILQFGAGIIANDLIIKSDGNDLLILVQNSLSHNDQIKIKNWYSTDSSGMLSNQMIHFEFSDGTTMNIGEINSIIDIYTNNTPQAPTETSHTLQDVRVLSGEVRATDADGDTLVYTVSAQAVHGTIIVDENGVWSYTAADGYMGTDSALITIDDGNGGVITQSLNFDIQVSAPTLSDTTSDLLEDTSSSGTLNIVNPIGGTLTYEVLNTSTKGAFNVNEAGEWNYNPAADLNGSDNVTIKVTNAYGLSTTATLSFAIEAVNDAPVLLEVSAPISLYAGSSTSGAIKASDVDGDVLSYSVTTNPEHGTLSINEKGEWSYSADAAYNGEERAIITIDDGNGGMITQSLYFTLKGYVYQNEDLIINDVTGSTLYMKNIDKDSLAFSRNGNDLAIRVKDESTVTLKNFFTNTIAGVQTITTAQGDITLNRDAINNSQYGGYSANDANDHLIIGDDNSNWLIGNNGNDIIVAGAGYDYINGGNGNDLLIGGADADNLFGGEGDDTIYADDGNDSVYAGTGNDEIFGGKGDDTLFADDGNDTINGGEGNDTIYAGTGNDTIKGGAGNDFINGTTGSDTYLFNLGDGSDTIIDTSAYGSSDIDTLVFGTGITKENLQIIRDNYDLLLQVNDNDSIRVKYWFGSDQRNTLESIVFADQSTLTTDQINNLAIVKGSAGNDWMSGIDYMNDHMYGFAGNDGLYGYGGNDTLDGGEGNDILNGGAGNDTLIGGTGSDNLNGGAGSDTYVFTARDGNDTITDWSQYGSNDADTISFGAGITKNDVRFIMKNGSLLIGYAQNDTINVQYAQNTQAQIEKFTLTDGNYLTSNDINVIIQSMNAYATDHGMSITSLDTVKNNQALMNIVAAGWHQ